MAEAILVDVTNAAKVVLADHDFGISNCEVKFSYADATRKLEKLTGKLHIDFVPFRSPSILTGRGLLQYDCSFDVIARKKFTEGDQKLSDGQIDEMEISRLILLMQDIDEFFITDASAKELTLASGGWKARIRSTDKKQDYSRPHLYLHGQFTGWNRVTYLAAKEF